MVIALRTDSPEAHIALLDSDGRIVGDEIWGAGRQLSGQLLAHIKELLEQHNSDWTGLTGVIVFHGPGSFTGLRIGITVANTIAYSQDISIIGSSGEHWITAGCQRLMAGENDRQVMPEYGAPPNITRPRGSISE